MASLEMRGFGTCRNSNEASFFRLVQEFAEKNDAVFFVDSGEGKCVDEPDFFATDLSGWIIPTEKADAFEALWPLDDDNRENWRDCFAFVRWSTDGDGIILALESA